MGSIYHLRVQHRERTRVANEILSLLDADRLVVESTAIRLKLSAFARKLRVHLVVEDRFIYERLLRQRDRAIVTQATEHQREAHSMGDRMTRYVRHWISTGAIDDAVNKFIDETKSILELASKRFDLEDRELYPLVDQICNA